jgi:hypothetical protein
MMYDDDHLYIAAHIGDPAPMQNTIDPQMDTNAVWRGGGLHVRLSTDRQAGWPVAANAPNYYRMRRLEPTAAEIESANNPLLAHLTMWYHAPTKTPNLTISYGMLLNDLTLNPDGFRGAFIRDSNNQGYVLEYSIPWRLLHCENNPPQPGDTLATTWQIMWSEPGGRLWRTQLVEFRNPQEPQRIFVWERAATWGKAIYE